LNTFYNIHPVDNSKKPMKDMAFNVLWDRFTILPKAALGKIPDKKFFEVSADGKFKIVRRRNEYKQEAVANGRNVNSMKQLAPLAVEEQFPEGTILVMAKPHRYFFHRKPRDAKQRYVYDPLNDRFYLIPLALYKSLGLSKISRGFVAQFKDGIWTRLGSKQRVKFKPELNHKDILTVQDRVSDDLLLWQSKGKVDNKCKRCVLGCKQPTAISLLVSCKQFDNGKKKKAKAK